MDPSILDPQAVTMGPPGPAAMARRSLADFYDGETANVLELARNAHEMGAKSSFRNLLAVAMRNRKFAEQARRHEKLQTILGQLAGEKAAGALPQMGPPSAGIPWEQPPAPQSVDPSVPGAPNQIPAYAAGGTHPGGPALVGEVGPEVVDLPAGSTVHPNSGGSPLLQVIRSLLDLLEQSQGMGLPAQDGQGMPAYRDGTDIPAYAYGTPNTRGGGYGRPQQPRQAGGYGAPAAGGGGGWNSFQRMPQAGAAGGARGYTGSGTEFRPGDIQGDDGRFNANQGLQSLIEHGASAGAYDPLGSEAAAQISKQAILGGMGARQAQSAKLADIYASGDPSFRAYARLKAGADTQSEAARAYEQSRAAQVGAAQGFSRDILGSQFGATLRRDPREPNPLAQIGGQIAGTVIGAAIPGGGGVPKANVRPAPDPGYGADQSMWETRP